MRLCDNYESDLLSDAAWTVWLTDGYRVQLAAEDALGRDERIIIMLFVNGGVAARSVSVDARE